MVSKNLKEQESSLYTNTAAARDDESVMALPGLSGSSNSFGGCSPATSSTSLEDPNNNNKNNNKIRKPYTITKSRESWTEPEHDKFLEALQLFDRDWKKIEAFIGSKTVIQIRSHAQKYFLKVQKSGANEHLPPPRPKRKAAHPYPHKALKNALPVLPEVTGPLQSSCALVEPGYVLGPDSSVVKTPIASAAASSHTKNSAQMFSISHVSKGDMRSSAPTVVNYSSSSTESTPRARSTGGTTGQGNNSHGMKVLPDFVQVYGFIGSVFDPDTSDHLQRLKKLDPIDVETVLLLMRNLSINLASPDFEDHRRLLSSYEIDSLKN